MTDVPYDFSGLHRAMSRREARDRRRAVLAGKSLWSVLEIEHFAGILVVGGINLFIVIPVAVVAVIGAIFATGVIGNYGDVLAWVLLVFGAPIAAAAIVYFSMRALLIPPRWRAWVRMHRFAEENGIVFVREEAGVRVPGSLVPRRASVSPPRLYDAFRDEARGIMLGDYVLPAVVPRGMADWLGVIVVRAGGAARDADEARGGETHGGERLDFMQMQHMLGDTGGSWSFELQATPDALVAVKRLPFRMRTAANTERAFRVAWAMRVNGPTRGGEG